MKILLTLMVKNESKILRRCMEAGARHADAVIVCDTGSTDNTVEIAKEFTDKPTRVVQHEWKNFGHNRTLSFLASVKYASDLGWDLNESYSMVLDGDMVLQGPDPHPYLKGDPGYRIIQKTGSLEYYNTRFMRLSLPWRCIGVTHEYWGGVGCESVNMSDIWINDIGDGGCKSDKFERDVRLLKQGLIDEPTNGRYMFYLAQSYRDSGQLDLSIEWYKKRIAVGGWDEEVWYAMYSICMLYARKGDIPKSELWGQRAHARRPTRAEPVYFLTKLFRERGDHFKAWHYLKIAEKIKRPDDLLFVETGAHGPLVDYERTILHYYVSENRDQGMDYSMEHINKRGPFSEMVFANHLFYTKPLACDWKRLTFPTEPGFVSTSIAANDGRVMNVRTVNYWVAPSGAFENPGSVQTRNYLSHWDPIGRQWHGFTEIKPPADAPRRDDFIQGLEDIRLQGSTFTATTKEYSYCDKYRIVVGTYPEMKEFRAIRPPSDTYCEKNWLPIDTTNFIYQWSPFQVGSIQDGELKIHTTHTTPAWFQHVRGSTPPFRYQGDLWTMVHVVIYGPMRRYLHQWVVLDGTTYKPKSYSRPFYFKGHQVEYSLSARLWGEDVHVFATIMERESWNGVIPIAECVKMLQPISNA